MPCGRSCSLSGWHCAVRTGPGPGSRCWGRSWGQAHLLQLQRPGSPLPCGRQPWAGEGSVWVLRGWSTGGGMLHLPLGWPQTLGWLPAPVQRPVPWWRLVAWSPLGQASGHPSLSIRCGGDFLSPHGVRKSPPTPTGPMQQATPPRLCRAPGRGPGNAGGSLVPARAPLRAPASLGTPAAGRRALPCCGRPPTPGTWPPRGPLVAVTHW